MSRGRVLVTGASGFIGGALVRHLRRLEYDVTASSRSDINFGKGVRTVKVASLSADTDWSDALQGVDYVVHCAARVHVMKDRSGDPLAEFRRANVDGAVALARASYERGIKRVVALSSIKVNGEESRPGRPFRERDYPKPTDPYGVSKLEAEGALRKLADRMRGELVIIRPPLVYGPGVKANFLSMTKWLRRGVPLPLGGLTSNRRTFIALDNLLSLIVTTLEHPDAPGEIFVASDSEDLSTTELLRRTAIAMGVRPRLVRVPESVLRFGATLIGRRDIMQRLAGNLQVDSSHAAEVLGWHPPVSVDEGLRRAVLG